MQSPNEYLTRVINQGAHVGAEGLAGSGGPGQSGRPAGHLHSKERPLERQAKEEATALSEAPRRVCFAVLGVKGRSPRWLQGVGAPP